MVKPQFILGCVPEQAQEVHALGCTAAHMCYRVSAAGKLMRICRQAMRAGIMVICQEPDSMPDMQSILNAIEREIRLCMFEGLFIDAEAYSPYFSALVPEVERLCMRLDRDLYVPALYAPQTENARVIIGSDVAAGSFSTMISEQSQRYGERLAIELIPLRTDFMLPSAGHGRTLPDDELDMLLARGMTPYFADSLCARYITYRDGAGNTHFTVYDDASTLRRKWEIAAENGVSRIFGLYDELAPSLPDILP